jgi:hypothetical protein
MSIYKVPHSTTFQSPAPDAPSLGDLHPLVDDTRTTGDGWHLRSRLYPTGDVEVLALGLSSEDSLKLGGGSKRKNSSRSDMDEETLNKSQRRARKVVKQKILTFQADTLLTLTYRENQTDLKLAWKHFNRFNLLMRRRYGDKWTYVAVPERQKRGAIHFHLAVKGYYHWNTVRNLWKRAIEGEGNVDFQNPKRRNGNTTKSPKKIAAYLSKYLTKQETTDFNQRRYSSSKVELPPVRTGWLAMGASVHRIVVQILESQTRLSINRLFEFDGYFKIVMATT